MSVRYSKRSGGRNARDTAEQRPAPRKQTAVGKSPSSSTGLLGLFAIPLGLAGLGGVWSEVRTSLGAPSWPAEIAFGASLSLWVALTCTYLVRGVRGSGTFGDDRRHAISGPLAAYPPIIGILLAAHYERYAHAGGKVATAVFVLALATVAAQLLAHWLLGNVPPATFHPGYLLPTVAGAFIASIGFSASGWHRDAQGAFGVGIVFWLIIGTLIFNRLFTGEPLPDPIKPSLAVLVSPPATATIAWLILDGGRLDGIACGLLAILFMTLLVQALLISEYRRLPFTTNFWNFTFPITASTNVVARWLDAERFPLWRAWSWVAAGAATTAVLTLAVLTITHHTQHHLRGQRLRGHSRAPARNMSQALDR